MQYTADMRHLSCSSCIQLTCSCLSQLEAIITCWWCGESRGCVHCRGSSTSYIRTITSELIGRLCSHTRLPQALQLTQPCRHVCLLAVQAVLVRISARLLKRTLLRTDERAKLEGELLDGIDVVKCMTWEVCAPAFADLSLSLGLIGLYLRP